MSGRRSGRLALVLIFAAVVCSSIPNAGVGQGRRGRDGRQSPQYRYATAFQSRDRSFKFRSRERPPKVDRFSKTSHSSRLSVTKTART